MTNRAQIHDFYKKGKYIENIFIFQTKVLRFGDVLGGWKLAIHSKFQYNICKIMPDMPKKHRGMGVNTTIDMSIKDLDSTVQNPPKACVNWKGN